MIIISGESSKIPCHVYITHNRSKSKIKPDFFCTKIQDNILTWKINLILALLQIINTLHLLWGYITKWQQHTKWKYIGPIISKNFTNLVMTHDMGETSNDPKQKIIQSFICLQITRLNIYSDICIMAGKTCSSQHLLYPSLCSTNILSLLVVFFFLGKNLVGM